MAEEKATITEEQKKLIEAIGEKASETFWLTQIYSVIDGKPLGDKIIEKMKELKALVDKFKVEEVV